MKRHIQSPTSATSRAALAGLRATINRISRNQKGLTLFEAEDAIARVLPFRAERASTTVRVAERSPKSIPEKHGSRSEAPQNDKRSDVRAKRQAPERDTADTIQTAHLHYHGNGVWSSNPSRLLIT